MKILVTGCAGFIGWKVSEELLKRGYHVVGIDNVNDYYDQKIKFWRLEKLQQHKNFTFYKIDIEDFDSLKEIFQDNMFSVVINEAARAGVKSSLEDPWTYFSTNVYGTMNLLNIMKEFGVKKFVLASTSSLYAGQKMPFSENLPVNTPISPYAASKKAAEVIAYTYHYLYGIDVTILRYFTVYGPAGRPDMSIFRFIYWIMKGEPLEIYGDGLQSRDFTYIDDIAEGTIRAIDTVGYEIINLGNNNPYNLQEVIQLIEKYTGKNAIQKYYKFHPADLKATRANIEKAERILGWKPKISLEDGIKRTVEWFKKNWNWIKETRI